MQRKLKLGEVITLLRLERDLALAQERYNQALLTLGLRLDLPVAMDEAGVISQEEELRIVPEAPTLLEGEGIELDA